MESQVERVRRFILRYEQLVELGQEELVELGRQSHRLRLLGRKRWP